MFQLLSSEVACLVWEQNHQDSAVQKILQALMDIMLGQVFMFNYSFVVSLKKSVCSYSCVLSSSAPTGTPVF